MKPFGVGLSVYFFISHPFVHSYLGFLSRFSHTVPDVLSYASFVPSRSSTVNNSVYSPYGSR